MVAQGYRAVGADAVGRPSRSAPPAVLRANDERISARAAYANTPPRWPPQRFTARALVQPRKSSRERGK